MERIYLCEKCDERMIHQTIRKCTCHKEICESYSKIRKCPLGTYVGDMQNGVKHGNGTWQINNGKKYTGDWSNEMRHGYGEYTLPNGEYYKGMWSNSVRHGHGIYRYPNGDIYTGMWKNGVKHGDGKWESHDGIKYEGKWVNDNCTFNLTAYIEGIRSRKKR